MICNQHGTNGTGIGKTAVLSATCDFAHQRRVFDGGIYYVSLNHHQFIESVDDLADYIGEAMGITGMRRRRGKARMDIRGEKSEFTSLERLVKYLRNHKSSHSLLVFDDVDCSADSLYLERQHVTLKKLRTVVENIMRDSFLTILIATTDVEGFERHVMDSSSSILTWRYKLGPLDKQESSNLFVRVAPRNLKYELDFNAKPPLDVIKCLTRHKVIDAVGGHPRALYKLAQLLVHSDKDKVIERSLDELLNFVDDILSKARVKADVLHESFYSILDSTSSSEGKVLNHASA